MTTSNVNTTPIKNVGRTSSILKTDDKYLSYVINDVEILARQSDGYVYATAMCRAANKRWNNYHRNAETQNYLAVVSQKVGIPISCDNQETRIRVSKKSNNNQTLEETKISHSKKQAGQRTLIESIKGRYNKQGIWLHPDVAQHLARWLSPEIDYAVTQIVNSWMNGGTVPAKEKEPVHTGTVTTLTVFEPGQVPRVEVYEDDVVVIPLAEYMAFRESLRAEVADHCATMLKKTSAYLKKPAELDQKKAEVMA